MSSLLLFSAGSNGKGQLAKGNVDDVHRFTACLFLDCPPGTLPPGTERIVNVACGGNHTLLLLERIDAASEPYFELWGCGDGSKFQLGVGVSSAEVFQALNLAIVGWDTRFPFEPKLMAAGWETSYVVAHYRPNKEDLLAFGSNDYGDLGIGRDRAVPEVNFVSQDSILPHGSSYCWGIESICAGPHHVVLHNRRTHASKAQEEMLSGWGAARHGQLGKKQGDKPVSYAVPHHIKAPLDEGISAIATGHHHTVFLHTSGRVSGLGSNRKNQLSGLEDLRNVSQIGCTWHGTYAVVREGERWSIVATGSNARGQLGRGRTAQDAAQLPPPGPVQFPFSHHTHSLRKMACGSEHVLCLFDIAVGPGQHPRTEVWGWGWNEHGNLGIGNLEDQALPVKVWPTPEDQYSAIQPRVVDIWAGCGTSWLAITR